MSLLYFGISFKKLPIPYTSLRHNTTLHRTSSVFKTPPIEQLPSFLKIIESKWKIKLERRFERERFYAKKDECSTIKPRYVLSMFPYPSGRLHLGHVRIYTSSDVLSRFSKLMVKNSDELNLNYTHVINPMGFDSFGLPAENAARERGLDSAKWTSSNIRIMKKQMEDLGLQFDWREATSNPSYYKWTQDLFLKLKESNLVYKSYAQVNWDPIDKTVLADEQVDEQGRSWRSGALVEKRNFKQWFIKVNSFTDALYKADDIDKANWRDILDIQRGWVGKPCGWLFYLNISAQNHSEVFLVFTRQPELFADKSTKILISKDHWLEKVFKISNIGYVDNPFTNSRIAVQLTDDLESLPPNCQATLINESSTETDEVAREQILRDAKLGCLGGHYTSDKYRDWLVSRQRYWGTPIPAIDCKNCGYLGVSREELPVKLPDVASLSENLSDDTADTITSPIEKLAKLNWLTVKCPQCGSNAKRECDTLDTLFDSSWYFLRYSGSQSNEKAFDEHYVQPVWTYVGGKEHAAMHLFYSRFITHFLNSIGELEFREPFSKLLMQGVVKGKTFKLDGRYISSEEVENLADKSNLVVNYEKMSKSKGNGVDPQQLVDFYGIDATRLCLLSYANPPSERLWRSDKEEFRDILIFMKKVCLTVEEYLESGSSLLSRDPQVRSRIKELTQEQLDDHKTDLADTLNRCLLDMMFYIQVSNEFRQCITCLHVLLSSLRSRIKTSAIYTEEFAKTMASLIVTMSPFTPHFSEELWGHYSKCIINPLRDKSKSKFDIDLQVSDQPWPLPNSNYPRPIKIKLIGFGDTIETIRVEGDKFRSLNDDGISDIVESHFKTLGFDDTHVASIDKHMDLSAYVYILSKSLKIKMTKEKKDIKKSKKT